MTTLLLLVPLSMAAAALWRAVVLEREDRNGAWLWIAISAACVLPVTVRHPAAATLSILTIVSALTFHLLAAPAHESHASTSYVSPRLPAQNQKRNRHTRRRSRKKRARRR